MGGSGGTSYSGFVARGLLKVKVASGRHAGLSYSEGFVQQEMTWFPPGGKQTPGVCLWCPQSGGLGGETPVDGSLKTQPRVMVRF